MRLLCLLFFYTSLCNPVEPISKSLLLLARILCNPAWLRIFRHQKETKEPSPRFQ